RNGLPTTAHATYDAAIRRVAGFGIDCIEHGGSMSESTIQMLVDLDIPIVTTFAPLVMQSQADLARQYNIPEWKIAERQRAVAEPTHYLGLIDAARAGVTIAFGTDAGSPVVGHDVIAPEMAFMVKLGVKADNYDAIRSATSVAARINGLEGNLGTLQADKLADVVVIDGNPLDELDAISRVRMTFLEGKRMV
ncbi:MAG: amidohydrolase family protein, partial [Chloroflexi bacterium]|nr:amidohydrolase family protein [Chloroflexota bacterium]